MILPALRVAVVEDEAWARESLVAILLGRADVTVVGEAADAAAAVELIRGARPDLVLLDIELPDRDAFSLIEELGSAAMPAVIFVTAHDRYAVAAFRVAAIDYVLKPFDPARVNAALDRARGFVARWQSDRLSEQLASLATSLNRAPQYTERVSVRETGRVHFVDVEDIEWIDAFGDGCRIHTRDGATHPLRRSIGDIELVLDPRRFLRIHRSTIVNVQQIRELRMNEWGDYAAITAGGQCLNIGRSYRTRLEDLL